jgi:hypothetical protein
MAGGSLGSLVVDVIAKVGGFVDGLSKAERESKKFRANVEKNLKATGTAFLALGVAGAAATAALVKSSIDNADALLEQSQAYGINIELLSAYQLGLEKAGSSSAEFATGLKGLANAVDADAEAFKRLQISTKNSDGSLKDSNTLLEEIADRFASMPDGITKTALAQDLFGKSGVKLIPFLNDGAAGLAAMREEAERLGNVISLETATAADQFNDNLATLKGVVKGTGNELAATLLPKLVEFTDLINDPETQQSIKDIVTGLSNITIKAVELASAIPNLGRDLAAAFNGAALGDLPRLQEELSDLQRKAEYWETHTLMPGSENQAAAARARIAEVEELILASKELEAMAAGNTPASAPDSLTPFVPLASEKSTAEETKAAAEAQKEWNRQMEEALDAAEKTMQKLQDIEDARLSMNEGMERELALYGDTSRASALRYEFEHGALSALSEPNKAYSMALAEQLDLKKKLAEQAANDEAFAKTEAGLQKQIDLLDNTSAATEMLYDIAHGGYEQFEKDQQQKLVDLATELEVREEMLREFKEQEELKAELTKEFARNTQNILADFLKGSFDDGLKGAFERFKQMLADMAAEAVAADIMKKVIGMGQGGGSGGFDWGSALSSVAGFFGGGSAPAANEGLSAETYISMMDGTYKGAFDGGGTLGAGQWGIAGENGAEIIRGPANITSTKDTAAMLGKGGNTNNVTFNFSGITNKQEAQQAASVAAKRWNRMTQASSRMG